MAKRNLHKISSSFRIGGLSTTYHNDKTLKIFECHLADNMKISEFVADCIVKSAIKNGFSENGQMRYVSRKRKEKIKWFFQHSKLVDYTYLWAFEYLANKRPRVSQSKIVRDCILDIYQETS